MDGKSMNFSSSVLSLQKKLIKVITFRRLTTLEERNPRVEAGAGPRPFAGTPLAFDNRVQGERHEHSVEHEREKLPWESQCKVGIGSRVERAVMREHQGNEQDRKDNGVAMSTQDDNVCLVGKEDGIP